MSPLPLVGAAEVLVRSASGVSLHGDLYLDLTVIPDGDDAATLLRVPAQLVGSPVPAPGDRLRLRLLMGQVDGVERLSPPPHDAAGNA